MTPKEFLDILSAAARLKTTMRHCWTMESRQESVADHSWRITLMAMLLSGTEEFRDIDLNKVMRMCLIHDLGEAFTGDIPTFRKSGADTAVEDEIFARWVSGFPEANREEWSTLLREMDALETREAKLYKALDRLEALISHNESDIRTWLPLEYGLQLTYGQESMQFSPWLTELRRLVDEWTLNKIENEGTEETPC